MTEKFHSSKQIEGGTFDEDEQHAGLFARGAQIFFRLGNILVILRGTVTTFLFRWSDGTRITTRCLFTQDSIFIINPKINQDLSVGLIYFFGNKVRRFSVWNFFQSQLRQMNVHGILPVCLVSSNIEAPLANNSACCSSSTKAPSSISKKTCSRQISIT